jgi:hypothetical protein
LDQCCNWGVHGGLSKRDSELASQGYFTFSTNYLYFLLVSSACA